MISVVIPVYNKASTIETTIRSVLNQTYDKFELIIVDDGSTDDSKKIIESFKDNRIRLYSIRNSGVSQARNYGVSIAKFNYVAFLDADDYWHPDYLNIMVKLVKYSPDAALYFSNFKEVVKKPSYKSIDFNKSKIIHLNNYFKFALDEYPAWTSATIVNKHYFYKVGGFNVKYSRGEDLELWTKLALIGSFVTVNLQLSFYNKAVSNSLTRSLFPIEKSFANDAYDFLNRNLEHNTYKEDFIKYMNPIIFSKSKYLLEKYPKEARKIAKSVIKSKNVAIKSIIIIILSYLPKNLRKLSYNIIS